MKFLLKCRSSAKLVIRLESSITTSQYCTSPIVENHQDNTDKGIVLTVSIQWCNDYTGVLVQYYNTVPEYTSTVQYSNNSMIYN